MSRIRIIGVGLLATVAILTIAAASASADPPELGRCLNIAPATGKYKGPNCQAEATATEHKYEWFPGPGAKPAFEAEGLYIHLERPTGEQVFCAPGAIFGKWTGPKTASVEILWKNCANARNGEGFGEEGGEGHGECGANPVDNGPEITTISPIQGVRIQLEGVLGWIDTSTTPKTVGFDIKP